MHENFRWARELRYTDDQDLDVYHATEYLTDLARAGFGGDGPAVKGWSKSAQKRLAADGWAGACEFVNASAETVNDRAAFESAYPKAANDLTGHRGRMNYAARLRQGKSIGSGMIEGTIKQMPGRRLRQTGARWKTKHVAPFAEPVALDGSPEWESYWAVP